MSIDNYTESIKATKPIREYPIGTKFPALNGGHWIRVERGFKWCSGDVFPSVGGDWNGEVILPNNRSREIKFRFWDSEYKTYLPPEKVLLNGKGEIVQIEGDKSISTNNIIVEQFTDLTDKNGVDIYEGDIIYGTWTRSDKVRTEKLLVECIGGCFYPFFEPAGYTSGMLYETSISSEDFEVIGNIHEHKHLLED